MNEQAISRSRPRETRGGASKVPPPRARLEDFAETGQARKRVDLGRTVC